MLLAHEAVVSRTPYELHGHGLPYELHGHGLGMFFYPYGLHGHGLGMFLEDQMAELMYYLLLPAHSTLEWRPEASW